jgi:hypothetical protein
MRVAVLLSGYLYNARRSAVQLRERLIGPSRADVFLVTSTENYERGDGGVKTRRDLSPDEIAAYADALAGTWLGWIVENDPFYSDDLALLYRSYDARVQAFRPRLKPEYVAPEYRAACIDQYLRLSRAWWLMRQFELRAGTHYDVVVRCRPDLVLDEAVDSREAEPGVLHVPCESHYRELGRYVKEFLFWGRRDVMEYVVPNFVDHYGAVVEPPFEPGGDADYTLCPEAQFARYLEARGVPLRWEPLTCVVDQSPFAYRVVRA